MSVFQVIFKSGAVLTLNVDAPETLDPALKAIGDGAAFVNFVPGRILIRCAEIAAVAYVPRTAVIGPQAPERSEA